MEEEEIKYTESINKKSKMWIWILIILVLFLTLTFLYFKFPCFLKSGFAKEICYQNMVGRYKINYCEEVQNRDICYKFLARLEGKESICENLNESEKDKCLGLIATDWLNENVCEKIKDPYIKSDCYKIILSRNKDNLICDSLPSGMAFDIDKCYLNLARLTNNTQFCQETTHSDECYFALGMENEDFELCKKSQNSDYSDYCFMNLSLSKSDDYCSEDILNEDLRLYCYAKLNNNSEFCDNIQEANLKSFCFKEMNDFPNSFDNLLNFDNAIRGNNPLICKKIKDNILLKECYFNVAINSNNETLCNHLEEGTYSEVITKNNCFNLIARNKKEINLCNNITDPMISKHCSNELLKNLAVDNSNFTFCDQINEDLLLKSECYLELAKKTSDYHYCEEITDFNEGYNLDSCFKNILLSKQIKYLRKNIEYNLSVAYLSYCDFESEKYNPIVLIQGSHVVSSLEKDFSSFICKISLTKESELCEKIPKDKVDECKTRLLKKSPELISGDVCADQSGREKDLCYGDMAVSKNDVIFCGKITEPRSSAWCYTLIAKNLKDSSICEEILVDQSFKDNCYSAMDDCEKIQSTELRSRCLDANQ